jgi:lipopolysaccharide export system protein LptA
LFILFSFALSLYGAEVQKVIITGEILNIQKKGDIIVSEGNSKAVSDDNTIKSKKMSYDKNRSLISANGSVQIFMKSEEGEPLEAYGDYGTYKTDTQIGEFYGDLIKVKYYMKDSSEPMFMNSKKIYFDGAKKTVRALSDVEIITTSGTVYSDNAFFYRDSNSVVVTKDVKRPVADILYDGKTGKFVADSMQIEKKDNIGSIKMRGTVKGKIKVDEEPSKEDGAKSGIESDSGKAVQKSSNNKVNK